MSSVFVLHAYRSVGFGWFGLCVPFDSLKTGHLINTDRVRVFLKKQVICIHVGLANQPDLGLKLDRVFLFRIEPVLDLVGLKRGLIEIATDLADRDTLYDFSANDFIRHFPVSP